MHQTVYHNHPEYLLCYQHRHTCHNHRRRHHLGDVGLLRRNACLSCNNSAIKKLFTLNVTTKLCEYCKIYVITQHLLATRYVYMGTQLIRLPNTISSFCKMVCMYCWLSNAVQYWQLVIGIDGTDTGYSVVWYYPKCALTDCAHFTMFGHELL